MKPGSGTVSMQNNFALPAHCRLMKPASRTISMQSNFKLPAQCQLIKPASGTVSMQNNVALPAQCQLMKPASRTVSIQSNFKLLAQCQLMKPPQELSRCRTTSHYLHSVSLWSQPQGPSGCQATLHWLLACGRSLSLSGTSFLPFPVSELLAETQPLFSLAFVCWFFCFYCKWSLFTYLLVYCKISFVLKWPAQISCLDSCLSSSPLQSESVGEGAGLVCDNSTTWFWLSFTAVVQPSSTFFKDWSLTVVNVIILVEAQNCPVNRFKQVENTQALPSVCVQK